MESSKFFISIYPHRNINNHEQFSKKIAFPMKEKFPELNKNYIMNDNYVFLIVNEYLTRKNYNKNIFISLKIKWVVQEQSKRKKK